jgi:chromosome segregation ATPase
MKIHVVLSFVGFLGVLSLGSACATTGHEKAESTGMHMDGLRTAVTTTKEKVNACAVSLASVVKQREVDPKPPFAQYKKDVAAVEAGLSKAESNLKSIKAEFQTYYAEWEKQSTTIQDPELKKSAEERRARLSKAVEEVKSAMDALRAEMTPYVVMIKDVETYLANDLTPAGIEAIEGKSEKVEESAEDIGEKLDDVVKALEKGAPEFKTAKPPPPAK